MEDLIYAYLHKNNGYEIIPSTNKRNTVKYEFLMKDVKNRRLTLQVKNGGDVNLNVENYLQDLKRDYDEIWLFTRTGKIIQSDDGGNMGVLCKLDRSGRLTPVADTTRLVDFVLNGCNRWRLPSSIVDWLPHMTFI